VCKLVYLMGVGPLGPHPICKGALHQTISSTKVLKQQFRNDCSSRIAILFSPFVSLLTNQRAS